MKCPYDGKRMKAECLNCLPGYVCPKCNHVAWSDSASKPLMKKYHCVCGCGNCIRCDICKGPTMAVEAVAQVSEWVAYVKSLWFCVKCSHWNKVKD